MRNKIALALVLLFAFGSATAARHHQRRHSEAWCDGINGPIGIAWVQCIDRARGLIK